MQLKNIAKRQKSVICVIFLLGINAYKLYFFPYMCHKYLFKKLKDKKSADPTDKKSRFNN